jgi:hypothetical protein
VFVVGVVGVVGVVPPEGQPVPLDGIVKLAVDVAVIPVPLIPEYTVSVAVAV